VRPSCLSPSLKPDPRDYAENWSTDEHNNSTSYSNAHVTPAETNFRIEGNHLDRFVFDWDSAQDGTLFDLAACRRKLHTSKRPIQPFQDSFEAFNVNPTNTDPK